MAVLAASGLWPKLADMNLLSSARKSGAPESGKREPVDLGIGSAVYVFGSPCDQFYGTMVFLPDGSIAGYSQPNEARWALDGDVLTFFNVLGEPTSRLRRDGGSGCWLGTPVNSKWPLALIPIMRHQRPNSNLSLPPVLINSIPKSGTYFAKSVFAELGWRPVRLHLSGSSVVDDFRDVDEKDMHVELNHKFNCPMGCVAAILKPGDLVTGHIGPLDEVEALRARNVMVLSMVRNLRNVLVSLCNFKLQKVRPTSLGDRLWREVADAERFTSFLAFYAEKDIEFIKYMATQFLRDPQARRVRFEDMLDGRVSTELAARLDAASPGLSMRFSSAVEKRVRTQNSTYSGHLANWRSVWNDAAERFFEESGLRDLNVALGYE